MLDSQEIGVYANRIQNSNSPQDTELVSTSHTNRFTIPPINLFGSVPTVGSARVRGMRSPRSIYLTDSATHGSSPSELGPARYGAYTSPPEAQTTFSIGVSHVATILGADSQPRTPTNTITPVQATIEVSAQVLSNTPSDEENEERFGEEKNDNEDDVITEIESSDDNEYQNCYECYEDQLVEENNSEETYYLWEEVDGEGPVIILYGPGENWGEVELVDWSEDEIEDRSEDEWEDLADINPPTIPGSPPYEVLRPGARSRYLDDLGISVNRLISVINITEDDG